MMTHAHSLSSTLASLTSSLETWPTHWRTDHATSSTHRQAQHIRPHSSLHAQPHWQLRAWWGVLPIVAGQSQAGVSCAWLPGSSQWSQTSCVWCCCWLCAQDFYRSVVLQKLNPGGIFITQSGPAGFLSCTEVFTCINATLRSVFPHVIPYAQHMPVFCDVWGWNLVLTDAAQANLSAEEMDSRLADRVQGAMRFLDGHTFKGICTINKHVRK